MEPKTFTQEQLDLIVSKRVNETKESLVKEMEQLKEKAENWDKHETSIKEAEAQKEAEALKQKAAAYEELERKAKAYDEMEKLKEKSSGSASLIPKQPKSDDDDGLSDEQKTKLSQLNELGNDFNKGE